MKLSEVDTAELLSQLNAIGIALSAEEDHERLLEMILYRTMEITNADGGTLYLLNDKDQLAFEIIHNNSLGLHQGGKSGELIELPLIELYDKKGNANSNNVAACVAINAETFNVIDAYNEKNFDFSGTRLFDEKMSYRSQSFLTVPMCKHQGEVIGVLQLINARDPETNEVRAFSSLDQQLVESLASQAAVSISNKILIDSQKDLFDAFIKLIAVAIDEKSPYTGEHCLRVPVITNLLARAVSDVKVGPLKDFTMTEQEMYELDVAAWLHDCGKITTPEYVVDKSTKLETIYDRIELVDQRFEMLMRDAEIDYLKRQLKEKRAEDSVPVKDEVYNKQIEKLKTQREYIRKCNIGGEYMADEDKNNIEEIAKTRISYHDDVVLAILSDEEITNLQVSRGTLTLREREIINNHVTVTIKMLESLPYPKHLERVPEYAGGHHERMDGSGYPNGLTGDKMSIPARMLAIADVFEALTAIDRPYKKGMPLSQALAILGRMKKDNHVDAQLFDIFVHEKVYLKYAEEYLDPEQIDEIDFAKIPGYTPLV